MTDTLTPGSMDEDKYERSKRLEWFDLETVQNARVLVVGAGAIGNETVKNLVLAGFRKITIVDMDHVVHSNLNRCVFFEDEDADMKRSKAKVVAEKAMKLDRDVSIEYRKERIQDLSEDFVSSFDVVLGCLDNVEARIHLNAHCYLHRVPYIDAATDGFVGKVQVVLPPDTPCLECSANRTHLKIMGDRFSCTGENVTFHIPKLAAEITTTSVVAAIQTRESLKVVLGRNEDLIQNLFYYDGMRNVSDVLEIGTNPECPHHFRRD